MIDYNAMLQYLENRRDTKTFIKEFLLTPYWKAIAEKTKKKAGFKCLMCNGKNNLATHHRTYDNHGDELYHMEDLVVICEDCHAKFHDKITENGQVD